MKIIFQNDFFVAVDKEPGVLSVPGRTAGDVRPVLGKLLEEKLNQQVFPVHRLDAEVSGLVLYALDAKAHSDASVAFENRQVQKTYQGFSFGGGPFYQGDSGEWTEKILRGKKRAYASPAGKVSITQYLVQRVTPEFTEWRLYPKTGRSHQLRWELYRHESPLIGDELYGSTQKWKHGGVALRSISLEFSTELCQKWKLPTKLETEVWS